MRRHLGVTGNRRGLSAAQLELLEAALRALEPDRWTLHHGDCIGADEAAHRIAVNYRLRVEVHPAAGISPAYRARCAERWPTRQMKVHPELPPLTRNQHIVDAVEGLIVLPHGPEHRRSGTWTTVRYARRTGIHITILWRDGTITEEGLSHG